MEPILKLENISKSFREQHVLRELTLSVEKGEFLTLLGSSGSGKTTILRIVAGLEKSDSGQIILSGKNITGTEPNLRNVNTIFQNYALFPHMNVYDNIAYPLKIKKTPKKLINPVVRDMLRLVQMEGFERRDTGKLSGGQKQRVAIARALINNPCVLLLDEPLGALDLKLRQYMQLELKRLQRKLGITFIYVTHDQDEALNMSDRIAVLNNGVIEQLAAPSEIYTAPSTKFVAEFVGDRNVIGVKISKGLASLAGTDIKIPVSAAKDAENAYIAVHSDKIRLSAVQLHETFFLEGVIKEKYYAGSQIKYLIRVNSAEEIFINAVEYNPQKIYTEESNIFISWDVSDGVIVK